jgi:hypothetical protein
MGAKLSVEQHRIAACGNLEIRSLSQVHFAGELAMGWE